jgi:hypothetical protein
MSEPTNLSNVPMKFLNVKKWASLRKFASKDIIALCYINAAYPDEEDPSSFFWDRRGSPAQAIHCYKTGRSLLQECRSLLNEGKLVASGVERNTGKRKTILAREWVNLWPMFATDKALGPDSAYDEIKVFEAAITSTPQERLTLECIDWLRQRIVAGSSEKKCTLSSEARIRFGSKLTHAIFNAAYLAVFARGRGRPRRNGARATR